MLARAVFRWGDCEVAETVDQIPVNLSSVENTRRFKGTKVSVLGLRDIAEWRKPNRGATIARSLARLISPFEATSTFPVAIVVDDVDHSLDAVTNEVLSRAIATFDFKWVSDFDGLSRLKARARFRKSLLAGQKNERQMLRTELAFGKDGGRAFHESLSKIGRLRGYEIKPYQEGAAWFIELEQHFTWSEITAKQDEAHEDPGPFEGVFNYFHLTELGDDNGAAATATTVTRKLIKDMAGISILRDGFRVRSPGDWLNMASEMTSGSTYGLRVDNTLGYFALTGEHNFRLTEKSDREGFVEDAPYRGFLQIARACRKFATDSMESVRRAVDQYAKKQEQEQLATSGRPRDPVAYLQKTITDTAEVRDLVEKHSTALHRDLVGIDMNAIDEKTAKAVRLASAAMSAMEQVKEKLAPTAEQLGSLRRIRDDIDDQRDQMISLFESAAVGLSARGLAHELRTHLTEIRQQTTAIQKASENGGSVQPMLRAIRGACSAIASSASLIDPMLPRSRAVKEEIDLESFVGEYVAGRRLSMERYGIGAVVSVRASTIVRMNRPRLLQVVDNLVQNSIYWMRHVDVVLQASPNKTINIEVLPTGLAVWDTGPGVSEKVEESLFEMFVSTKPDGNAGQGLGLFIVSQLLDIDGCRVMLSEERNSLGRRFRFVVDLSAVLSGGAAR
jgi:signal transduction histidine kinase